MRILLFILLVGCGMEIEQTHEANAELIVRYPEMSRCFDALEEGLIDSEEFMECIEIASEHTITVDVNGDLTEIPIEDLTN